MVIKLAIHPLITATTLKKGQKNPVSMCFPSMETGAFRC